MLATTAVLLALIAPAHAPASHPCPKLFTVAQGQRAARAVYTGTRQVSIDERRMLGRIGRCQRNPHARRYVRWFEGEQRLMWQRRLNGVTIASWYDDSGSTASGEHFSYGFASLMFGNEWGHEISFCVAGRAGHCAGPVVTGQLDDHGPYVGGRGFDLNPELRDALNCSGLCPVYWRSS